MIEGLKGKFYPTTTGSLPYKDPKVACEKVLKNFSEIPFWPQLIRRSFLENMYVQFAGGFPGVVVDQPEKKIYVDTSDAAQISGEVERLYEKVLNDDVDFFSIGRDHAEGLYALVEEIKASGAKPKFAKGQITGPVSFGLTVTDEKKRPLFYNTELKEVLIKTLCMRARWQVRKLKETGAEGVIIFIDEPYLASIGSSFISLQKEDVVSTLNEVAEAIHKEGGICGMHCCGNTDWGLVLESGIEILNFDAYNFSDSLLLYPAELKKFLGRGGLLAWGIVPNTQDIRSETADTLIARLSDAAGRLAKKGIKKEEIFNSMIISPTCGLGLIDDELAELVIKRTIEISEMLRKLKF